LRAGVAEDDLSEKALGTVCFVGLEVAHAIFNPAKRRQAFCVPKGLARSGATEGRRNVINVQVVSSYSWAETESSKTRSVGL
jgi:hypothetical protein